MDRIGVRELRQNASRFLKRVQAGESLLVTDRGKPIARLVPVAADTETPKELERRLIEEGVLIPAELDFRTLPPPLAPKPGQRPLSEILAEMRAEESF